MAGFTVMAQRRLRALGMLGSLGATDRHIRLVMLANGAAVGATAAVVGAAVGLAGWLAFVPTLQSIAEHRVDRFALPWWAIAAAMLLTFVTAVPRPWWPARAVARIPIVAALSGRPPRPQPAHRFAALGRRPARQPALVLLAFADQHRAGFIIGGTVATAVGLPAPGPAGHPGSAPRGRGVRRSRSGWRCATWPATRPAPAPRSAPSPSPSASPPPSPSARPAAQTPTGPGNLPANQLMLYLTPAGGRRPGPAARRGATAGR